MHAFFNVLARPLARRRTLHSAGSGSASPPDVHGAVEAVVNELLSAYAGCLPKFNEEVFPIQEDHLGDNAADV